MLKDLLAFPWQFCYVLDQLVSILHAGLKVSVHLKDHRVLELVSVKVAVNDVAYTIPTRFTDDDHCRVLSCLESAGGQCPVLDAMDGISYP